MATSAVFVLAGAMAGCSSGTSVYDVTVGDCLMQPEDASEVTSVEVVDCAQPHDYELYAEFEVDMADSWPGTDAIADAADLGCYDAFGDFVGVPYEESELFYMYYSPSQESWEQDDDRLIQCLVFEASDDFGADVVSGVGTLAGAER